jgi:galactokinase
LNGDLREFGKLVFACVYSSIHAWETGSPELKGRYSGAGFKGCCMALIDPACKKEIEQQVTREHLQQVPEYKDLFSVHFCNTDDEAKVE